MSKSLYLFHGKGKSETGVLTRVSIGNARFLFDREFFKVMETLMRHSFFQNKREKILNNTVINGLLPVILYMRQ